MPLVSYGLGGVHTYTRAVKVISRNQVCTGHTPSLKRVNYVPAAHLLYVPITSLTSIVSKMTSTYSCLATQANHYNFKCVPV